MFCVHLEMSSPSWQIRKHQMFYQPSSTQKSIESPVYGPGIKRGKNSVMALLHHLKCFKSISAVHVVFQI